MPCVISCGSSPGPSSRLTMSFSIRCCLLRCFPSGWSGWEDGLVCTLSHLYPSRFSLSSLTRPWPAPPSCTHVIHRTLHEEAESSMPQRPVTSSSVHIPNPSLRPVFQATGQRSIREKGLIHVIICLPEPSWETIPLT